MATATEAMNNSSCSAAAEQRRQRAYAMLDAADPARGAAIRWCERAHATYAETGDLMEARCVLRGAIICGMHPPSIYRAWIAMEERHSGDAVVMRALFQEWRFRPERHGGGFALDGAFWCRYIAFELAYGGDGGESVRNVAEAAVASCPRDPAVHAAYAKAELSMGHRDRARRVVERACRVFLAAPEDAEARETLMEEVMAYNKSLRSRGRLMTKFSPFRLWSRQARRGYQQLGKA